jgi:hypothetical protein
MKEAAPRPDPRCWLGDSISHRQRASELSASAEQRPRPAPGQWAEMRGHSQHRMGVPS